MIVVNGVGLAGVSGYGNGNAAVGPFTVNHSNAAILHITCGFDHYGQVSGYGCARRSIVSNGTGALQVVLDDDHNTTNAGAWAYTRVTSIQFTIGKTAGSYNGNGYWFIEIVGHNILTSTFT